MDHTVPQEQMHRMHHEMPKFEILPHFNHEDFLPPMPELPLRPIIPLTRDLIRAHVAGKDEKYSGSSYSSHSHSTIINGKETFEGGVSSLVNNGKDVVEKIYEFKN